VRSDRRQSEFERLPGIGPVTAQVIGAFRFERGTFSSVDQLLHLRRAEDRRGELVPPVPGHEHAARVVDPQLSTGRLLVLNLDGTSRSDLQVRPLGRLSLLTAYECAADCVRTGQQHSELLHLPFP
jgi:hypothetical protein